ncbi:MAG TPA: hypothetical protein VGF76_17225 [Polyangiaceae bacterium]|jgi:hypothetical protein
MKEHALIIASVVWIAACSNDVNFDQKQATPFAGEWSCWESGFEEFPGSTASDVPTKTRYLITSPVQGQIVVTREGDAGSCALQFSVQSANAMLLPGQSCPDLSGTERAYASGTATVASGMFTMNLGYSISEAAMNGSPARNGTGDQTEECTR